VDIHELKAKAPARQADPPEELRLELLEKINALGVGAQGLGGLTTVLERCWTTPATPPTCRWPWCPTAPPPATATSTSTAPARPRSSRQAGRLARRHLDAGPQVGHPVNLDTLTKEEVASWKPGQKLLLNGKMLTGRDAAHKRIADMLAKGESCRWTSPTA
jgi:fumarate hydratase class I